jgi:predicted nuclease of restriction endonuclease-like RecB superfamily
MAEFGHVHRLTREVGGKMITFRSKGEYKWCVWCELRKQQGIIKDWWYEDAGLVIRTRKFKNKKVYLPDFVVQMPDDSYELEEFKGYFTPKDYTKIRLTAEQYENPITLIFANLTNCKSNRAQYNRAKRLEPHVKRIIYDANKSIFKPIRGLFEL